MYFYYITRKENLLYNVKARYQIVFSLIYSSSFFFQFFNLHFWKCKIWWNDASGIRRIRLIRTAIILIWSSSILRQYLLSACYFSSTNLVVPSCLVDQYYQYYPPLHPFLVHLLLFQEKCSSYRISSYLVSFLPFIPCKPGSPRIPGCPTVWTYFKKENLILLLTFLHDD